jgi:hypothetical protein
VTSRERYDRIAERLRELIATGEVIPGAPVSDEAIAEAELELGHPLSPSLKWFLQDFGPAQFPALPKTAEYSYGRPQILAPGAPKRADLVASVRSLRKGTGDLPPLPQNLYPFEVTECRVKRARIALYNHLDPDDLDGDGEHRFTYFTLPQPFKPRLTHSFLDWLEGYIIVHEDEMMPAPPYEESAERLRSDACRDQYIYGASVPEEDIAAAEKALGFTYPEGFRRFLMEFGAADLGQTLSPVARCTKGNTLSVLQRLSKARPQIPSSLVPFASGWTWGRVVQFVPRYICFDRDRVINGEPCITEWAPKARKTERLKPKSQTFLGWLGELASAPEKDFRAPRNWRNIAGWDRYWTRTIADDFWREAGAFNLDYGLQRELDWLRKRGYRRILFAGNGISLEPYAYAHLGFDATAVDVSHVASEFVQAFPVAPVHLSRFLPAYLTQWDEIHGAEIEVYDAAKSLKRVEREGVGGGRVRVITADMFSFVPDEPFDVVYSNRAIQGFDSADRVELARRMADWVRPGGACVVESMNVSVEGYRAMEDAFASAGFFIRGIETDRWFDRTMELGSTDLFGRGHNMEEREARWTAEGMLESERLAGGEKVVIFYHGSG